jgi:hypothetical protein
MVFIMLGASIYKYKVNLFGKVFYLLLLERHTFESFEGHKDNEIYFALCMIARAEDLDLHVVILE